MNSLIISKLNEKVDWEVLSENPEVIYIKNKYIKLIT